jgi:phosphate butyryltransferase
MFRAMLYFGQGKSGGVVVGAKVPLVLLSRAESAETKIQSMAIARLVQQFQRESAGRG